MPTVRFIRQVIRPDVGPFAVLPDPTCEQWSTVTLSKDLADLCVQYGYAEIVAKQVVKEEVSNG